MIISGGMVITGGTAIVSGPAEPAAPEVTYRWFVGGNASVGYPGNIIISNYVRAYSNTIIWSLPLTYATSVSNAATGNATVTGNTLGAIATNIIANAMVTGTVITLIKDDGPRTRTNVTVTQAGRIQTADWNIYLNEMAANITPAISPGFYDTIIEFKSNIGTTNWTI